MAGLFCTEAEFEADVQAMQEAYEARCKAGKANFNPERRVRLESAAAASAYGDWAWNPRGQREVNATPWPEPRAALAPVVSGLWLI